MDRLFNLYDELIGKTVEFVKNKAYQGSIILDIFLKRKALQQDPKADLTRTTFNIPTFNGATRPIFVDTGYLLSDSDVEGGIYAQVNQDIKTKNLDVQGVSGIVVPAHITFAIETNKERLLALDELARKGDRLVAESIMSEGKKLQADIAWSYAWSIWNGRGGANPQWNNYTYNTPSKVGGGLVTPAPNAGIDFVPSSVREVEGLYTYVLNGTTPNFSNGLSNLYNIDLNTFAWYKPKLYNFFTANSAGNALVDAPFGYNSPTFYSSAVTAGNKIKASVLMGTTYSMTANVPVIIDIIQRAISDLKTINSYPQIGICRRDLFDLLRRVFESQKWSGKFLLQDERILQNLANMGYNEAITIDGVAIIPDDTKRLAPDGQTAIYACPANAIFLLNLDKFIFEYHYLYPLKIDKEWKEKYGKAGAYYKVVDATVLMALPDRHNQGVIQFAEIDYSA